MSKSNEIVQIEEIDKGLTKLNQTLGVTADNYLKLVKTIAGNTQAIKETTTSYDGLEKAQKKTKEEGEKLDNLAKRLAASERRLKELTDERTQAIIYNNIQVQQQTNEAKRQVIINKSLEGSYEQLNAELNSNINKYKQLSQAERENALIGGELIKNIMLQDQAIKKIDETMGRHQRNVGNYKSGFNGLNFSIMQIGRELPSLAYGANVFASAISNNIPMMTDELKKARTELANLRAEGKQGVPIWKQVAGAVFSWQTAMVVGLTLFTVYGKEIFTWIGNLFKSKEAIDQNKIAQDRMNEALKKGYESGQNELVRTRLLYEATQSHTLSIDQKRKAIRELQDRYPEYLEKFSEEEILAGKAGKAYYELANAIMASAKAKAFEQVIIENEVKKLELENKITEDRKKLVEANSKLSNATEMFSVGGEGAEMFAVNVSTAQSKVDELTESIRQSNIQIAQIEYSSKELADRIKPSDLLSNIGQNQFEKEKELSYLSQLEKQLQTIGEEREKLIIKNNKGTFDIADEKRMTELETQARKINELISSIKDELSYDDMGASMQIVMDAQIEAAKESAKITGKTELELQEDILKIKKDSYGMAVMMDAKMLMKKQMSNKIITDMERSMVVVNANNLRQTLSDLEKLEEAKKYTVKSFSEFEKDILESNMSDEEKKTAHVENEYKKRKESLDKYLENKIITQEKYDILEKEIAESKNNELKKLKDKEIEQAKDHAKKIIDEEKDKAEAIRDIQLQMASDAINGMFDMNNAKLENDLSNLEKEKEAKLSNENLTKEEKIRIEEEYDKKAGAIKKKQAQADKIQSLFQIALSTAVGSMKAVAEFPLTGGMPFLAWVIASGVLQSAMVAAQPIPQFAKGTDNAPDKGLFGEAGREIMRLRSGETLLADSPTYFQGSKFKGAQIYSNPETERLLSDHSGGNTKVITDERLLHEMRSVRKAIIDKPVQIVNKDYQTIGQGNSRYQQIYLNKLTYKN
jgi:hypothetical protein